MTSQEQDMIQGLVNRVNGTQLPEKDVDAEHLLQQSLAQNPDALYILAQTVLVQKYALEQAQKQLSDLKAQLDQTRQQQAQPQHHTSFLGSLLGHDNPPPPAQAQPQQVPYSPVPSYAPQAQTGYAPQAQTGYSVPPPPYGNPGAPQGGGFLRSAMQTATGVAAGALAFQGIESLMHGFGGGGGFAGSGFGGPREEVVNNYYGDDVSGRDLAGGNLSPDIEDRRDDSSFGQRLADADTGDSNYGVDSNSGDDNGSDSFDGGDSNAFDSGGDDSSFDSGGGDDSNFS